MSIVTVPATIAVRWCSSLLTELPQFDEKKKFLVPCRRYLYQLRWPEGFICPRCTGRKAWMTDIPYQAIVKHVRDRRNATHKV
jgi:hypothetical protein